MIAIERMNVFQRESIHVIAWWAWPELHPRCDRWDGVSADATAALTGIASTARHQWQGKQICTTLMLLIRAIHACTTERDRISS